MVSLRHSEADLHERGQSSTPASMAAGLRVTGRAMPQAPGAPTWGRPLEPHRLDQTLPLPKVRSRPTIASARRTISQSSERMQLRKFWVFCFIGGFVFLVGLAIQWVLVKHGVGSTVSYVLKGVVTIELSFALNRVLTWRDRHVDIVGALLKWNAQKLLMSLPDVGAYALLVWLGMNWLTANIVITGLFSVINYVSGHFWSFRGIHMPKHRRPSRQRTSSPPRNGAAQDLS